MNKRKALARYTFATGALVGAVASYEIGQNTLDSSRSSAEEVFALADYASAMDDNLELRDAVYSEQVRTLPEGCMDVIRPFLFGGDLNDAPAEEMSAVTEDTCGSPYAVHAVKQLHDNAVKAYDQALQADYDVDRAVESYDQIGKLSLNVLLLSIAVGGVAGLFASSVLGDRCERRSRGQ